MRCFSVTYGLRPADMDEATRIASAYAEAGATATRGADAHDPGPYLRGVIAELAAHRLLGITYRPLVLSRVDFQRLAPTGVLVSDVPGFGLVDIKASGGRLSWFVRDDHPDAIAEDVTYVGATVSQRDGFLPFVRFHGGSSGATVKQARRPFPYEVSPGRESSRMLNRMLEPPFDHEAREVFGQERIG